MFLSNSGGDVIPYTQIDSSHVQRAAALAVPVYVFSFFFRNKYTK